MRRLTPILLLLTVACQKQGAPPAASTQKTPQVVAAVKAERADVATEMELAGEFRAYQDVDLHAKVAGYLRKINVDIGSVVKAGDVIATLEVPEMGEELAQALAAEKRAQLDIGRAKGDLARAESTLKLREVTFQRVDAVLKKQPRLMAQQEIDDASSKYADAQGQVEAAKANLSSVEQQVQVAQAAKARIVAMTAYLQITAPFSGVITKRYADTGAMIQAGTASHAQALPVVKISEVDRLRLIVPVPESIVSRIKLGAPIEVRVDALQRILQGRVSRSAESVVGGTRTMEMQIDIPNPGHVVKPGMFAHVMVPVEQRRGVVTVPVMAVLDRQGPVVLAVNGEGKLEERRVKKGLATPDRIEIVEGIRDGEIVVAANASQLKAGDSVTPKMMIAEVAR